MISIFRKQNLFFYISAAIIMAVIFSLLLPSKSVSAANTTKTQSCLRKSTANARIVISGNRATAYFTVPDNCKGQVVSLVSYKAPNGTDHKPYSAQQLYKATTRTFNITGERHMSVEVPDCYFQVDLARGNPITTFSENVTYGTQGRLLTASGGGNKPCFQPTQTTKSQSTIHVPPVVITNTNVNNNVAKTPQAKKVSDEARTPAPPRHQDTKALPDTGPGELAAFTFGISMTAGLLYAYRGRFDEMLAGVISRF